MQTHAMYYFLSSPYLSQEMDQAVQARIPVLKRNIHTQAGTLPIPKSMLITRLRKTDPSVSALSDDKGRIMLSPTVDRAISDRPLLIYWTDGASRLAPWACMQAVARSLALTRGSAEGKELLPPGQRDAYPSLCMAMGGSLGLNAHVLDDKIAMQKLLCAEGTPSYIPWTMPFHTSGDEATWRRQLEELMSSPPTFENEHLIFKPSDALKQKGIIVLRRDPANIPALLQHVRSAKRSEQGPLYQRWVVQSYVVDPFMVSGVDLGLIINQACPTHLLPPGSNAVSVAQPTQPPSPAASAFERARSPSPTKHASSTATGATGTMPKKPPFSVGIPPTGNMPSAPSPSISPPPVVRVRRTRKKDKSASDASTPPTSDPSEPPRPATAIARLAAAVANARALSGVPAAAAPLTGENTFGPSAFTAHDASNPKFSPSTELPSDSGLPVLLNAMYKVHFRIYAIVKHDLESKMFDVYGCRLFKLYHSALPSALVTSNPRPLYVAGEPISSDPYILLHARTNHAAITPPIHRSPHMIDVRDVSQFGCGVSNCLAMRLGNDILSPALTEKFLSQFHSIVSSTVSQAIGAGGFGSYGMARVGFQVLGFDFLYDIAADRPVLLEVNDNVGQGMFPKSVMLAQGMTEVQYAALHQYWTKQFREPFCEGVVERVLDELYGLPAGACAPSTCGTQQQKDPKSPSISAGGPAFTHLLRIPQPTCTPPPDIYAYTHGIPPVEKVKRRVPPQLQPTSVAAKDAPPVIPSPAPSASFSLSSPSVSPSPSPTQVRALSELFPGSLSPAHSAAPASPLASMLSVRSLTPTPASVPVPAINISSTMHSNNTAAKKGGGSNSPRTPTDVIATPAAGSNMAVAPQPAAVSPRASIVSASACEIVCSIDSASVSPPPPTFVSVPYTLTPANVLAGPALRNTPALPPSLLRSTSTVVARPPLTIRFSSTIRPVMAAKPAQEEKAQDSLPPPAPSHLTPQPPQTIMIRRKPSNNLSHSMDRSIEAPFRTQQAPMRVAVPTRIAASVRVSGWEIHHDDSSGTTPRLLQPSPPPLPSNSPVSTSPVRRAIAATDWTGGRKGSFSHSVGDTASPVTLSHQHRGRSPTRMMVFTQSRQQQRPRSSQHARANSTVTNSLSAASRLPTQEKALPTHVLSLRTGGHHPSASPAVYFSYPHAYLPIAVQ